jgi:TatA/E family protein of Tat protein translocase
MLALLGPIGTTELVILAVLGLLIFGRRLPEVGRNLGKGLVEFKKGLSGVKDEIDQAGTEEPPKQITSGSRFQETAARPTESVQPKTKSEA